MTDIIEAQGLSKRFGLIEAVRAVDLSVTEGEIFGLVGPDGAGKTTLMRLIATILMASGGDARVGGFSVTDEPQLVRKLIGYMSQRFTLYADLTVIENLLFFANIYQIPEAEREQRTGDLLVFSNLTEFIDRPAGQLSGGMKQKLALACTLVHEPKVLLLDEPTTGVDPVSRREFWKILARLHQGGTTIFVTTPYMDEAERCQRVAFMQDGAITLCDTPAGLKKRFPGRVVAMTVSDTHAAAGLLRDTDVAQRVDMFGQTLQVTVEDATAAMPMLRRRLEDAGIAVKSMNTVELSMENVFVHLADERPEGADV